MSEVKIKSLVLAISSIVFSLSSTVHAESGSDAADKVLKLAAADSATARRSLDTVVVNGEKVTDSYIGDAKRETAPESTATLSKVQLEKFVGLDTAITGALKYLPGIHFSGGDSSGISEGKLSVRGFSQDQLGFIRDGVPLNDPLYLTPHNDFMGDPENYDSVNVLYGSAAVDAPSLTSSGGSVLIKTVAPTKEAGFQLKQSIGSDATRRTFARGNFGETDGFSGWLSASRTTADIWQQGNGDLESNRYEGNLQYLWGNNNSINAIFSIFKMDTNSLFNPTLAQYRSRPYDAGFNNVAYPTGGGTNGVADILTASGNSAPLRRADFQIQTYGLNGVFNLTDALQLKVDPYFVRVADGAASVSATSLPERVLNADLNHDGDKLDVRPLALEVFPTQYRIGGTSELSWNLSASNNLKAGAWLDSIHATNQLSAVYIDNDGSPRSTDGGGIVTDDNGNKIYFTDQRSRITTQKYWLADTWEFAQQWSLTGSLAWQHTKLEGENIAGVLSGSAYSRSNTYSRFLPSAKLSYQLNGDNQFYYSSTSNIRTPAVASVYIVNPTGKQDPETTWNQELGWRYNTADLSLSAAVFYDQFKNRQVSFQPISGVTDYFNAGGVTSKGLELSVNGQLPLNFNYLASWTYVKAEQDSDYSAGGVTVSTQGNQLYDTPRNLISAGIGYDDSQYYSNLLARYTSEFYGDLANREKLGGYTVVDLNLGYRLKEISHFLKSGSISLNLNNVFDKQYLGGVNSGTVSASSADGKLYGPPTYNVGQPRNLLATLTLNF